MLAIAIVAPVLAVATGLALYGLREGVSFFYTPSQARAAGVGPDRVVRVGGLVRAGSVSREAGDAVRFIIEDGEGTLLVRYRGDLPDLFREGQGIVAQGRLGADGAFRAEQVLAKHDENYMPSELKKGLEASSTAAPTLLEARR